MSEPFVEDVGRKARWFYETRGHLSREELSVKRAAALEQVDLLRQLRDLDLDPGGGRLAKGEAFALAGADEGARAAEVANPYEAASDGFATDCVSIERTTPGSQLAVRLRPVRGSSTRLDLRTAKLFVFDPKLRQWNLVEHSGYNARSNYVWGLVHRDGVYAAMALPNDPKAVRRVALERFAYYHLQLGIESGVFARASDYFDDAAFRLVAEQAHEGVSRAQLTELTRVHRETLALKRGWRGQLPNGGLAEWDLVAYWGHLRPSLVTSVDDLLNRFPWLFVLNRVGRWFPYGPYNVNGRVKSLAVHPSNGAVLYAGAADGGIWKTTSAGGNWRHLWTFEDSMAVGSVAVAESSPNTIYVATGEDAPGWSPSYGGVGVYKSTDGGSTWTQKSNQWALGGHCTKILVHPSNRNIVYLASENGVHKSTDGGDTWTTVLNGHASDLVMAHDQPNTLYAGMWDDGLYKTANGGGSWSRITSDVTIFIVIAIFTIPFPTGNDAGWIKLAIGRNGPWGSNFVIAKLGPQGENTYATFDGGASWGPAGGTEAVDYDEWTSMVAIHPNDERRLFLGGLNLQYSPDGFNFHPTNGTHSDHHQVVFDPTNDNVVWCCCDGGVYRSTDRGVNWSLASYQLQATQLMSLGVSQVGSFLVGGATQDQGIIQTSGSLIWDDFGGGNEWGMFVVDQNDSHHVYVSPGDGQLRRSADGGHSWSNPTQGLTDPWPSQNRQTKPASFAHVAVRPGISNFLIGGATVYDEVKDDAGNVTDSYGPIRRLYYSRDWGQSWWNAHTLPSAPSRVAYAPSDDTRAYAATGDGRFYRNNHGGELGWYTPYSNPNKPPAGSITDIAVHPYDADTVYITYGNVNPHVYVSTDGGAHWASASGILPATALPDIAVSALFVDPENTDMLYAGTDIGVFRSNNAGSTWFFDNDADGTYDLPKVIVTGLGHMPATGQLFASTMGRGLYYTYTSGFRSLRVLAVSYRFHGTIHAGIQYLQVTDGAHQYIYTRAEVIRRIEAGTYVYTVGANGSRAEVMVMDPDSVHPIQYLKTNPDATTADNLESLPRF
jgi:photosystem II stability/assembly factor-like uncharacterized protein